MFPAQTCAASSLPWSSSSACGTALAGDWDGLQHIQVQWEVPAPQGDGAATLGLAPWRSLCVRCFVQP